MPCIEIVLSLFALQLDRSFQNARINLWGWRKYLKWNNKLFAHETAALVIVFGSFLPCLYFLLAAARWSILRKRIGDMVCFIFSHIFITRPGEILTRPGKIVTCPGKILTRLGKILIRRDTNSPGRDTNSPGRDTNSPGQDTNSPGQDTNLPGRDRLLTRPGEILSRPGEILTRPGEIGH